MKNTVSYLQLCVHNNWKTSIQCLYLHFKLFALSSKVIYTLNSYFILRVKSHTVTPTCINFGNSAFIYRCTCFTSLFNCKLFIGLQLLQLLLKSRIWLRITASKSFMIYKFGKYKPYVSTLSLTAICTCIIYKICLLSVSISKSL